MAPSSPLVAATANHPVTLQNRETIYALPLIQKDILNHDSRNFRFALPSENHVLGLPIGQHVQLIADINGETVTHSYTPTSMVNTLGYVDIVIKVYFANTHPAYPEGGRLTQFLDKVKIGETVNFRGPKGRITYLGKGNFLINQFKSDVVKKHTFKHIGMIAGGSGVTPFYQLIAHIFADPEDTTKMSLLYANKKEDDILLRKEFDELAAKYPDRLKIHYTLEQPPAGWTGSTGYVTEEMIAAHMPPPTDPANAVFHCGPKLMNQNICFPLLEKLGYSPDNRHKY